MNWESPYLARFLRGLARHARLIITDRRGWRCSERFSPTDIPDVDALTDDILVIMDAVGSTRAAILASFESTIVASLFAASYPERTAALILVDPFATYRRTQETPWMPTIKEWEQAIEEVRATWGTLAWTEQTEGFSDTREGDWFRRYQRGCPGSSTHVSIPGWGWVLRLLRRTRPGRPLAPWRSWRLFDRWGSRSALVCTPGRSRRSTAKSAASRSASARVASEAGPSEVLVSQTVKDLVAGSGLGFEDRGDHELKGVPDTWKLYRVAH